MKTLFFIVIVRNVIFLDYILNERVMKKIYCILFFTCAVAASDDWEDSKYFDTTFLRQYDEVRKSLVEDEQFQEGDFNTPDNVRIHYLWKKRAAAKKTVICCGGYSPGRKEGLASLYAMLPEDTNILFFDARDHGQSETVSFQVWRYGLEEYQDIVGAVEWVQKKDDCPIVLWSICSGAFNATHAVRHLATQQKLAPIKAMVFDSGWASISRSTYSGPLTFAKDSIRSLVTYCLGHNSVSNFVSTGCEKAVTLFIGIMHRYPWSWLSSGYEQTTSLFDKMNSIPIPVFFIHSEDDTFIEIDDAKELAQKTANAQTWWITEQSKHACHHIKHKKEYRSRFLTFMNRALQDQNQES